MPNKEKFINELFRVTAPGGRIIIVTWCHRELEAGEVGLSAKEQRLLDKINDAYFLPDWVRIVFHLSWSSFVNFSSYSFTICPSIDLIYSSNTSL